MPAAPDLVGRALDGRYELHSLIGEGAFGRVYRGLDRRLDRQVAVKVIKPWWAEDSAWVERFQREAQLLARVSDPGIVQIFDIGHAEEGPYYVAELVLGESLAERIRRAPMSLSEALAVAERLCHALASAHAEGIVHCDVKPANVLLSTEGSVKVGDFGVARLAGGTSQALSATVAGTPRYMAPEQARGRPTTPATDVYSAGIVLYETLAGQPPFADGSPVELGLRHVQDSPPALPARVPAALRAIVARALQKEPAERYADGAAMAAALAEVELEHDARAAPDAAPGRESAFSAPSSAAGVAGESPDVERAPTQALGSPRTRLMPRAATPASAAGRGAPELPATERRQPDGRRVHPGARRRRGMVLLAGGALLAGAAVAWLLLLGGNNRTSVPGVVGQSSAVARSAIARAGLRSRTKVVAAPGSKPGLVTGESPRPGSRVRHGSAVALLVAAQPRWRELTTFSGIDDGQSVPVRIEGKRWRVIYSMYYEGTCLLLIVCFGPSAEASNLHSGARFDSFDLSEGSPHSHVFDSGPGLYRVLVSGGNDSARWTMNVQDYY